MWVAGVTPLKLPRKVGARSKGVFGEFRAKPPKRPVYKAHLFFWVCAQLWPGLQGSLKILFKGQGVVRGLDTVRHADHCKSAYRAGGSGTEAILKRLTERSTLGQLLPKGLDVGDFAVGKNAVGCGNVDIIRDRGAHA